MAIRLCDILEVKLSISLEEMKCCKEDGDESTSHSFSLWRKLQFLLWGSPKEDLFGHPLADEV